MPTEFSLADKAYYVAEYLKDLKEARLLFARTVCEKYEHTVPGAMGRKITPEMAIRWAGELVEHLY